MHHQMANRVFQLWMICTCVLLIGNVHSSPAVLSDTESLAEETEASDYSDTWADVVAFLNDQSLEYIAGLGSGQQATIYKVKNVTSDTLYALKVFNDVEEQSCFTEEAVLHRIKDAYGSSLRIPTIHGQHCSNFKVILMDYIDGTIISNVFPWTPQHSTKLIQDLEPVIEALGEIGIGHFDLNRANLMLDTNGGFWLIDFGLAMSIPIADGTDSEMYEAMTTKLEDYGDYVVGTWAFYSPQAMQLNEMIRGFTDKSSIDRETVKHLIIAGNKYSLQAISLYSLLLEYPLWYGGQTGYIQAVAKDINDKRVSLEGVGQIWTMYHWLWLQINSNMRLHRLPGPFFQSSDLSRFSLLSGLCPWCHQEQVMAGIQRGPPRVVKKRKKLN